MGNADWTKEVSRQTLGTVVIGGMLGATLVDIFIVPVTFFVVENCVAHFTKKKQGRQEASNPQRRGDRRFTCGHGR